jgi:hypothetical protein
MKNTVKFITLAALLFLFSPEMKAQATSNGNGNGQNNSNGVVTYATGIVLTNAVTNETFVFVAGVAFSPVNLHGMMQSGQVSNGEIVNLRIITGGRTVGAGQVTEIIK